MKLKTESKVLIQGINQPIGALYATRMKAFGTNIVAGVGVGGGGQKVDDIPVFDLVEEVIETLGKIDLSLIFVPPYQVLDAALESINAGVNQLIITSRGVPPLDMVHLLKKAQSSNTIVLGSGSQGVIIPEKVWLGIHEPQFYSPGKVGIISRCDRLTDEVAMNLTTAKLGQSMAVNLGIDGIIGSNFEQWLQTLEEDDNTEVIVLLGQINGFSEVAAAEYIASTIEKPVIAYLAGLYAPIDRSFGDAATIIATQLSSAAPSTNKDQPALAAFKNAAITIAQSPWEIPSLVKKVLKS